MSYVTPCTKILKILTEAKMNGKGYITVSKKDISEEQIKELKECGYIVKTLQGDRFIIKQ